MRIEIDIENEDEIFSDNAPGVVPFYMKEEYEKGEKYIHAEVYSGFADIAGEFFKKFEGRYFSDAALTWIYKRAEEYLGGKGYFCDNYGIKRYYHSFEAGEEDKLDTSFIQPTTKKLDREYTSLVTFDLPELISKSIPAFVTVIDDRAVSIAAVNENIDDEIKVYEITVETSPAYRQKGYGVSNTAALADYLTKMGYKAAYCTSRYNSASNKIARKIGFKSGGRFYAVAGYKN